MPGDDAVDDVQRVFRHLVLALSEGNSDRARQPIEIAEIYQSILPYRRYRNILEFDSYQDYEMAVLRLLSGVDGLASVDPVEVQTALSEEANAVNPNPGAFRDYAAANVYLNINAIESVLADRDPYAPPPPREERSDRLTPSTSSDAAVTRESLFGRDESSRTGPSAKVPRTADTDVSDEFVGPVAPPPGLERGSMFSGLESRSSNCPFCHRGLPSRRHAKFCPYCGHNLGARSCPSCGNRVGPDWAFCIECGTDVAP